MRGGGGGGTPLYKPYRYVPPHRVGFLCGFGLKTGIRVYAFPILVWNRVWFLRELRDCKISLSKERKICEFEMDLKNFFLRSNLSNDNIISA